jgi:hypothetical protein
VLREGVLFIFGWHANKKMDKAKIKRDERLKVIP